MPPEYETFFAQLYRAYFYDLKRYAVAHLNPEQAEDIVQDTFHEAIMQIHTVAVHPNPGGWLVNTLHYKILNCQRANQKDMLRLTYLDPKVVEQIAGARSIEDAMIRQENNRIVQKAIEDALTENDQYIIKRLVIEKASHKDVAEEMQVSVWTSQKRLERVREKLDRLFPGHRRKK